MWHTTDERPEIVYTAAEASAMDTWLVQERGWTIEELMGHAGRGLAEAIREIVAARALERVVLLVGPGNNGGDAVVAGRLLADELRIDVWRPLTESREPQLDARMLVVDGLFGVGLARAIDGDARAAVELVDRSDAVVLAVDVPSGISATTGAVVGSEQGGVAVVADATLTFVGPKQGFFEGEGPAHVGRWKAVPIGFPIEEADAWLRARRAAR